jgi:hypothetical protein
MPTVQDLCFDADWYLSHYKDLAAANVDAQAHYLKFGRFEGRRPCAKDATPVMRAWDAAQQAAAKGQWDAVKTISDACDLTVLCHPDATLLRLEALTVSKEWTDAQEVLADALSEFGNRPALALAAGNLVLGQSQPPANWVKSVGPAFPKRTNLDLPTGSAPALDRLTALSKPKLLPTKSLPKVTVIVPVLNAETTLATALRSLRAQTTKNLEVLVVDNGSTDASADIAKAHAADDPRIQLLDGSNDKGAYPARNLGLAAASGDFITVQDADDWAHPDKIAQQVKALIKAPSAKASLSDWARATPDLRFTNTRADVSLIHPNISSLMIRAELRDSLGFWDRVRADADTEYHRRILHAFGAASVLHVLPNQLLSIGRSHDRSLTQTAGITLDDAPRQTYQRNAAAWHARHETPYLEQHPQTRPFPAPDPLTKGIKPA